MKLSNTIYKTIHKYKMFAPGERVVVAISGGADSVALLSLLAGLKDELKLGEIFASHLNHCLRGDESLRDEEFVRQFCHSVHISLVSSRKDVKDHARLKGLGIEEAGRDLRLSFLEETRISLRADKIAIGHNADDSAETIIMNLLRGTGLKGLTGIPPTRGKICRPLIDAFRSDIENYCTESSIPYVTDSSNLSYEYLRNRIRNIVIPVVKENVNKSMCSTLVRNAELLRDEELYLEQVAMDAFMDCLSNSDGDESQGLDLRKLESLHPAIARRVVRLFIRKTKNLKDVSAIHINNILKLLNTGTGKRYDFLGLVVTNEYGNIKLHESNYVDKIEFSYPLSVPSSTFIPEINKTVTVSYDPPNEENPNLICTNPFNYDNLIGVTVRSRFPGDKIVLKNADGASFTKKLKDYFIDSKIPVSQRDKVPLLAQGNEVVWIMTKGGRVSANIEKSSKSQCIIWVSLLQSTA